MSVSFNELVSKIGMGQDYDIRSVGKLFRMAGKLPEDEQVEFVYDAIASRRLRFLDDVRQELPVKMMYQAVVGTYGRIIYSNIADVPKEIVDRVSVDDSVSDGGWLSGQITLPLEGVPDNIMLDIIRHAQVTYNISLDKMCEIDSVKKCLQLFATDFIFIKDVGQLEFAMRNLSANSKVKLLHRLVDGGHIVIDLNRGNQRFIGCFRDFEQFLGIVSIEQRASFLDWLLDNSYVVFDKYTGISWGGVFFLLKSLLPGHRVEFLVNWIAKGGFADLTIAEDRELDRFMQPFAEGDRSFVLLLLLKNLHDHPRVDKGRGKYENSLLLVKRKLQSFYSGEEIVAVSERLLREPRFLIDRDLIDFLLSLQDPEVVILRPMPFFVELIDSVNQCLELGDVSGALRLAVSDPVVFKMYFPELSELVDVNEYMDIGFLMKQCEVIAEVFDRAENYPDFIINDMLENFFHVRTGCLLEEFPENELLQGRFICWLITGKYMNDYKDNLSLVMRLNGVAEDNAMSILEGGRHILYYSKFLSLKSFFIKKEGAEKSFDSVAVDRFVLCSNLIRRALLSSESAREYLVIDYNDFSMNTWRFCVAFMYSNFEKARDILLSINAEESDDFFDSVRKFFEFWQLDEFLVKSLYDFLEKNGVEIVDDYVSEAVDGVTAYLPRLFRSSKAFAEEEVAFNLKD
ncbi:MAG: hypothetical protein JXR42_03310 [Gammaproteobacteria bacterium]|nr:hypothetical protein [Gammaproteobacteria bacterium]